ncbi:MAG TPA: hypothetical protein VFE62_14040 [Gemmataceae bacterium]|nr:hypothetical protein [Gemmataceae bacterium]
MTARIPNRPDSTWYRCDRCGERVDGTRDGERLHPDDQSERAAALRLKFAEDDFADVQACDLLIAFTEQPSAGGRNRGGRHVELGIAIGQGKRIMIVGPRENIFCWLPEIDRFDTFDQCLCEIGRIA